MGEEPNSQMYTDSEKAPLSRVRPSYRLLRRTPVRAVGNDSERTKPDKWMAVGIQTWLGVVDADAGCADAAVAAAVLAVDEDQVIFRLLEA